MKHFLEKISILSLSLMLVSTFAVTPALPAMIAFYDKQGIAASQVEFLITATSFAIMAALLLVPFLENYLSERVLISTGLVLMAVGGSLPLVTQVYGLIFLGRLVLGLGLGLINARAINLISTHFHGQERLQLLGLRGSAEVLGSASLTALVGSLLAGGWSMSFAIYLFALLILVLYLAFVPQNPVLPKEPGLVKEVLRPSDWRHALFLALVAAFVIQVNTLLTLKIPIMVTAAGFGTARQASLVLSAMMMMGIVAGAVFSPLTTRLGTKLLPLSLVLFSLLTSLIGFAGTLWILALGAIFSGFFYSTVLTIVFNRASSEVSKALINQVMTVVLVGCNLGGASASLLPAFLEQFLHSTSAVLLLYATLGLVLGISVFIFEKKS